MAFGFQKIIWMPLVGLLMSCNDLMLGEEPLNTPKQNFELLWKDFDSMYGLFGVKNLDWNMVYQQYAPQVQNTMDEDELFDLFSEVLGELNDGHVWMVKPEPGFRRFDSGPKYPKGDFDLNLVRSRLTEERWIGENSKPEIIYGKIKDEVGYIYMENLGLKPGFYEQSMEKILPYFKDTKGLIFDARGIEGGDDRSSQVVAGYFSEEEKLYMTTRFRNGPGHDDFTALLHWKTIPSKANNYKKSVIVLTNRETGSAGETFIMAMKTIDKVTVVGDSTYGAFSDNPKRELPNGWIYSISVGDFRDAEGKSFEGIGIPPDVYVKNTPTEIRSGIDNTLEWAISQF